MQKNTVFRHIDDDAKKFYEKEGYLHLRQTTKSYQSNIQRLKNYYETLDPVDRNKAFRSVDGTPRQFVNIFRDESSLACDLYKSELITKIIDCFIEGTAIFTHAKVSFKIPFKETDWYYHQDNGYKNNSDLRNGFAIFICLEDMNENNGCLKLIPKSHLLGKLNHVRKVEHIKTGDNQLILNNIPKNLQVTSKIAKQGDIIVFHSNTIHGSGSSRTDSKRFSLISEVEPYEKPKLDDYGLFPIFAKGELPKFHKIILFFKQFFNPLRIWFLIKRFPKITVFLRKLRY